MKPTKFKDAHLSYLGKDRFVDKEQVIEYILNGHSCSYYSSGGQLENLESEISDLKNFCRSLLETLIAHGMITDDVLCTMSNGRYEVK